MNTERFTSVMDGTDRIPFPLQAAFLEWLAQQTGRVIAAQLPTGVGKSFILRTVQRAVGATGVVSSNMLMGQYEDTYGEDLNTLKGAAHYECSGRGLSCGAARELDYKPCPGCPYNAARTAALHGEPTIFNPMSLYMLAGNANFKRPKTTVVDEAHTLPDMLMLLAGERFLASKFRLPTSTNSLDVIAWLTDQIPKVRRLAEHFAETQNGERATTALRDYLRMETVLAGLQDNPQNYVIFRDTDTYRGRNEEALCVRPLQPPQPLLDRVLGTGRIVLLSATLSKVDAELLAPGQEITYYDAESPIPAEQRPVFYRPMPVAANARTPPEAIAAWVTGILKEQKGNCLVHSTYAMNGRIAAALNKLGIQAFANTTDTKEACIARFKKDGGVFVAAGCAEGLDLPDDGCRLNLVPVLPRLNPTEPTVQKWLALPGGRRRYELEALRTLQQQVGRSTRHVKDWSRAYVGDSGFPAMYGRAVEDLPKSFKDAVRFTRG